MQPKTLKELIESSDGEICPEAMDAAIEYEMSLIPDDLRIPKSGEVYKSIREINLTVMIQFFAPVTGGNECVLPVGVDIEIGKIYQDKPIAITGRPALYEDVEQL